MKTRVTVRRGGEVFSGWLSVSVESSIEDAASVFTIAAGGRFPPGERGLLAGDQVEIYAGPHLVLTGSVSDVEPSLAFDAASVTWAGVSRTAEAIDCSAPAKVWRQVILGDLIAELLGPYDIGANDEAGVLDRLLPRVKSMPGESVFDLVERWSREQRLLLTDDERGLLTFTRAGLGGQSSDDLRVGPGGNVLSLRGRTSARGRYSRIEVLGQQVGAEGFDTIEGSFDDRRVDRFRRLIIVPERGLTQLEALARAEWEAATRAGRSVSYTYTLGSWTQTDGEPWRKNRFVTVHDPDNGFNGASMLITAVAYELNNEGERCRVTVSPPAAYTPEPVREPRRGTGRGTSGRWARWDAGGVE